MAPHTHQHQIANRLSAVTQSVGFALWQLQELEGASAQYFVLLAQAEKGMGIIAGEALIEKAQNKTFGATIHQIAKAGLLSPELETRFTNLLSERNWLVHSSRSTSRSAVHNDTSLKAVVNRVTAISDESLALLKEIGILVERFVKQHGVTRKYIDENANELLEQWHASNLA